MRLRQKRIIYAIVPFLLLFGIFEIALRKAGYPRGKTYMIAGDGDPHWEDSELFWTPPEAFAKQFNKAEKNQNKNLIYCYGGSIVQGFTVQKPFASLLEQRLRAECNASAAVVNWAAQGYTSYQSRVIAERSIAAVAPRIIIECNAWNDHEIESYSDLEVAAMNRSMGRKVLHLMNRSVAFAQMRRVLLRRNEMKSPGEKWPYRMTARVPAIDYREQMERFVDLAESSNADLVFLTQAQYSKSLRTNLMPYHNIMVEIASSSPNVHLVDIRPAMEKVIVAKLGLDDLPAEPGKKNSYVLDLCHPSEKGHELISNALFPLVCAILKSAEQVDSSESN